MQHKYYLYVSELFVMYFLEECLMQNANRWTFQVGVRISLSLPNTRLAYVEAKYRAPDQT